MSFLPPNYREPDTSDYMRLKQGENVFRVLSSAIVGQEYWKGVEGKREPVRKRMDEKININDLETDKKGNLKMPKHFWAFVVWNREAEKVQILELTQATIRRQINALVNSKAWGDPKEYDIAITRIGEGFQDTEYSVMPCPKEKIDKGIVKMYEDMDIKLEKLYSGDDPFNRDNKGGEEINVEDIPDNLGEK